MSSSKRLKIDNVAENGLRLFKSCLDECLPLKSLDQLKNWKPSVKKHATIPLQERASLENNSKTLVCHDMKGGYLEDRHINGSNTEDNYYFLHWTAIDIFVYFSHNLVTLPPCGWISAAHKNGVKVLGTFITESDGGIKVCDDLFETEDSVEQLSMQLVNIANYYNFDGWLLNIENKLQVCQIPLLEKFIRSLTTKMHLSRPGSAIIWYDSVLKTGDLKWQNALNENNRLFFDCCDGIFLNYNWTAETLEKSAEMAGERKADVFVGADVFGRGCPGGGGFATSVAVSAARENELSSAIFGPGWVHECLEVKDFKENQFRFWQALQYLLSPRKIKSLPYYSSFCPGFGKKLFKLGKVISNEPWYNLSLQQPQPMYFSRYCSENSDMSIYEEDSFHGGGCLSLTSSAERKDECSLFKILETSFTIDDSIIVSYTFKKLSPDTVVNCKLCMNNNGQKYDLYLGHQSDDSRQCLPLASREEISESHYEMNENPTFVEDWIKSLFVIKCSQFQNQIIEGICVQVSSPCQEKNVVLLGELEVLPFHPKINFGFKDLVHLRKKGNGVVVRCTLFWSQDPSLHCSDLYFISAEKKVHICRTSQYYHNLELTVEEETEVKILLSPLCNGSKYIPDSLLKIPIIVPKCFK